MSPWELRQLQAHFEIASVWFNESDSFHHGKRLLRAVRETRAGGLILDKGDSALIVQVLARGAPIEHEVRRRGIIDSRQSVKVQVCVGDFLMVYVSYKI